MKIVKHYRASRAAGVFLDDELLDLPIAIDPAIRVQPIDEHHHVLWLPVLCEGPAPHIGEPEGAELESER